MISLDYALDITEQIIMHQPKLVVCGSVGLMLHNILPERAVGDIDFACNEGDFKSTGLKDKSGYGPFKNKGYDCYKIQSGAFYYNVFVHKELVVKSSTIMCFKVQFPKQILKYKQEYNRLKDQKDLQAILSKRR